MGQTKTRLARLAGVATVGVALYAGQGCEDDFVCDAEALAGLEINVVDSLTGEPLAVPATVVVTEGAIFNELQTGNRIYAAHERPGSYDIEIRAEGYETWHLGNVVVGGGPCGVEATVRLTARMIRSPPR